MRILIHKSLNFHIDLRGSNLRGLRWNDFSKVKLCGADLSHSNLSYVDFAAYEFIHDVGIDFSRVSLLCTNLTGTDLRRTKRLTQSQLTGACADPETPPDLKDLVDAKTDKLLVWRGDPTNYRT